MYSIPRATKKYGVRQRFLLAAWLVFFAFSVFAQSTEDKKSEGEQGEQGVKNGDAEYAFNIPSQPLHIALDLFAQQSGLQIFADSVDLRLRESQAVSGRLNAETALAALLTGSGLAWYFSEAKTVVLYQATEQQALTLPKLEVSAAINSDRESFLSPGSEASISFETSFRTPIRDTADVLDYVAGVSTSQSRQDPGVSVNIRGMQDFGRVNNMIDGVRQNFQRSGHGANGSVYLDPQLLSRVEVSKGPSSKLGGAGVIGGSVNFRTVAVEDLLSTGEIFGGRSSMSTGDNGWYFNGHLATAWQASRQLAFVAALGRKNLGDFAKGTRGGNQGLYWNGVSQFTGQSSWSGLVKSRWDFTENQRVEFAWVGYDTAFTAGSDTLIVEDGDSVEPESINQVRNDTVSLRHQWSPPSTWLDLDTKFYLNKTQFNQSLLSLGDNSDSYDEFDIQYATHTAGVNILNISQLELSAQALLTLSYGLEAFHDWTRPQVQLPEQGEVDASWFNGPTPEGERSVGGVFFDANLARHRGLNLSAGLRYDYFSLSGEGEMFVGSITNPNGVRPRSTSVFTRFSVARHDGYFSPTLDVSWWFSEDFQLYLKAGLGARPPAITETLLWGSHVGSTFPFFPNPSLEAERSQQNELGFNFNKENIYRQWSLRLKTAWFENRVDNFIIQGRVMGPASVNPRAQDLAFVNLQDAVVFRGYEFRGELLYGRYFFADFNWTRTLVDLGEGGYDPYPLGSLVGFPPTELGNAAGITYALPPKYKGNLNFGAHLFSKKVSLGMGGRRENHQNRGGSGYQAVMNWVVYDAWLKWHFSNSLHINFSVKNFNDRNYAEANGFAYWVAPGRTATAGLYYEF